MREADTSATSNKSGRGNSFITFFQLPPFKKRLTPESPCFSVFPSCFIFSKLSTPSSFPHISCSAFYLNNSFLHRKTLLYYSVPNFPPCLSHSPTPVFPFNKRCTSIHFLKKGFLGPDPGCPSARTRTEPEGSGESPGAVAILERWKGFGYLTTITFLSQDYVPEF